METTVGTWCIAYMFSLRLPAKVPESSARSHCHVLAHGTPAERQPHLRRPNMLRTAEVAARMHADCSCCILHFTLAVSVQSTEQFLTAACFMWLETATALTATTTQRAVAGKAQSAQSAINPNLES